MFQFSVVLSSFFSRARADSGVVSILFYQGLDDLTKALVVCLGYTHSPEP